MARRRALLTEMAEVHRLAELDMRDRRRFVAVCTCGWVTEAMTTAGLAHACLDGHVGEVAAADQ